MTHKLFFLILFVVIVGWIWSFAPKNPKPLNPPAPTPPPPGVEK
jgi:hypothetical protein